MYNMSVQVTARAERSGRIEQIWKSIIFKQVSGSPGCPWLQRYLPWKIRIKFWMKTGNNRKYLLIFSGVLLAYQYLGLVIDGNIPYTQIKISSQANISIALTILIFFFGSQYSFYWFKQKKEERSLFEFASSIPIGLIAIVPICYNYLKKFGIDWKVIVSTSITTKCGWILWFQ